MAKQAQRSNFVVNDVPVGPADFPRVSRLKTPRSPGAETTGIPPQNTKPSTG